MEHLTNAAVTIEVCRSVLIREGQHEAAEALFGLELLDSKSAVMAYNLFKSIRVHGETAISAKTEALNALRIAAQPGSQAA